MFPASVFKIDNGLTLIHQEISTTPIAVADVWVKAGANLEPESWCGMAHFLEHMIFKGTEKLEAGVFDQTIEFLGGVSNAATSYDYAHYSLTTASNYLEETLPLMGELLLNAAIPEIELNRERNVILEEIRQAYNSPDWMGFEALCQSIYPQHPYGRSILGSEQDIAQHQVEQLRCFHRAHYQPENMTIAIAGGISASKALELVNKAFNDFSPPSADFPAIQPSTKPCINGICREQIKLPRLEQARLLMAWLAPGVDKLRICYGLDLLSVILAGGRASRLIADLRENRQLVNSIGSSFSLQQQSSLFTINAWLESKQLESVEKLIRLHLEQLISQEITEQELNRAKRMLCNDYAFSTETPNQLAGLYGYYNTIASAELSVNYPQEIQSFDSKELQNIAYKYLSPDNYAVTVVKPEH
ncbi:putative Zn-dependent peptidase [Rivularia sp. PCC 7116]|uniref:M16 family metallopeptidase n=1 Tax=Rivularia sp. PCC 7116 TaxID=373994 RepID=UPI00029EF5FC|nr:pitrilysin family protein [Rivularia sp. PCC 7116]AFY59081.1 putative Zn-dependent peptidase [Rivularia sp. PCC 7116]